ncbi:MAG: zinc dependent phospholipase C family protein [Armatimonadetes bacterium]|nr:zinc dependent phospholipase C family protein [Armatimonadota bacterium]
MTELGHLLAADRVFVALDWAQELRPSFYLGSIAPDAHRATVGVDYRDLHFRSSRQTGRRLIDFLRQYLRPALMGNDAFAQAFYTGWLTHICADHVWRQHLRHELSHMWHRIVEGASLESAALRDEFYEECDWTDQALYERNNQRIEDIRWMLQHASIAYTVPPLKAQDINRWRQQVIMEMMPPVAPDLERPQLLSVEFVERCLEDAVQEGLAVFALEAQRPRGPADDIPPV